MFLKHLSRVQIKRSLHIKSVSSESPTLDVSFSRTNIDKRFFINSNLTFSRLIHFRSFTGFSNHERLNFWRRQIENDHRNIFISHILYNKNNEIIDPAAEKDLEILAIQYPHAKNVLHQFFDMVSTELQIPTYKLIPTYKSTSMKNNGKLNEWTCTYSIKWPEEHKFNGVAQNKRDASYRAACKVLLYLQKTGKILKDGTPIIYDKEAIKRVTNESNFSIKLNHAQVKCLDKIHNIFENNLKSHLNNDLNHFKLSEIDNTDVNSDLDVMRKWSLNRRKLNHNLSLYTAKESIKLPIQEHREEFERLLSDNRVVIIRGEPGCGKSTRIPQYALEHWVKNMGLEPANVVVTQPRRIAAISLAERVAQERNEMVGNIVGYQVRLKSAFNPHTGRILYCTTGILLRQFQSDPILSNYTHIILDEVHERDVNTDLLMNLVRHALDHNENLKLIIMSATIDVTLFQNYFENAPVMNIPGFTYPVTVNFLDDLNLNLHRTKHICDNSLAAVAYDDVATVVKWIDETKPEGAILCFLPGWEEISKVRRLLEKQLDLKRTFIVVIHSKLSHDDQRKIFSRPPQGVRKVILATNIAETSVTVNDVVYVIDTGIHKESRFDAEKGVMCIDNYWISQANMSQRKGRAGRVQPGESFHLYPKEKWRQLQKYSIPEILRVSLTKIVLDAKVCSNNMDTKDFFANLICPPTDDTVSKAVEELQDLDMLDVKENLTPLGRVVSDFQLEPKLSKAMIHSVIYKCVIPIVDIATLFSSDPTMFSNLLTDKEEMRYTKMRFASDSDHIALMILFEQWANLMENEDYNGASRYCAQYNLLPHKLNTIKQLKDIHYNYLAKYLRNALELSDEYSVNKEFIKGVLLSGVGTVLLHRNWDIVRGRMKKGNVFLTRHKQKATVLQDSVNYKRMKYETPFLLYINEIRSEMRRTSIIRETSLINPLTFILFKNCELLFNEVLDKTSTEFMDPVLIRLDGTKFRMLCDREQAMLIQKCKYSLRQMEKYFVYQLTKGGEAQADIVQNWDEILYLLNELLKSN